jgi:hypothetical protein
MIRGTEPYNYSIDLALNSTEVQQTLGVPVTVGWFAQGGVNVATGGDAELNIPLTGAHGKANIRVNATKRPDSWKYWTIRVDTYNGEHIDLLEP